MYMKYTTVSVSKKMEIINPKEYIYISLIHVQYIKFKWPVT